jgi:hypothetical protein
MTRVTHYTMDGTLVSTHDYVWPYWTRLITGVNYCLSPIYYYGDCTIETCLDPWTASTYTKAQGKIDDADHVVQVSSSSPFVAWYALPAGNLTGSYAPEAAPLGTTGTWDSNGSEIVVAGQVATTWGNHRWSPFIKPYSLLPATVTRAVISALKPPRNVFLPTASAKGTVTPPTVSLGA